MSALCTGHLYPPRKYFWCSFLLAASINPNATVRARRIMSVTPPGTEPSIFELVAQCLNCTMCPSRILNMVSQRNAFTVLMVMLIVTPTGIETNFYSFYPVAKVLPVQCAT